MYNKFYKTEENLENRHRTAFNRHKIFKQFLVFFTENVVLYYIGKLDRYTLVLLYYHTSRNGFLIFFIWNISVRRV